MRLIDADAITYDTQLEYQHDGMWENTPVVYKTDIDAQPTVDAIPIAWLEEKLTNHPEIPYVVTDGINAVLDMWREEHETD